MSIESDLRKDGIRVVDILDTMTINRIAHNIAKKPALVAHNFHHNINALGYPPLKFAAILLFLVAFYCNNNTFPF